jgi:hypothetical protein
VNPVLAGDVGLTFSAKFLAVADQIIGSPPPRTALP